VPELMRRDMESTPLADCHQPALTATCVLRDISQSGFPVHEKKSARSLMMCFLAQECGYWQVSQS
jgi:hypothetical protein